MTIHRKVRCIYADTLECFIVVSTKGECKHYKKHERTSFCNVDYCTSAKKINVTCVRERKKNARPKRKMHDYWFNKNICK
jgi:hypothetical protein